MSKIFLEQKIKLNKDVEKLIKHKIIIQEGYLSKEKTYIPYNIIQNVDINNGPIMRKFGYSHITIKVISNEYHLQYIKNEISEDIKNAILDNKNKYKFKF